LNGTSNYFTVPYSTTSGTSDATYFLYARSSALESAGVQFIQGQVKTGSSDNQAYSGSSSNFKVLSFPPNATAINSPGTANESANVAIFRIAWGTTYWHDLHFSPNNNNIYHRVVFNSNPIDWRIVVETTGNKGNSTKPVYVSGGLIYECDAYPTKASWNYDDKYVTAVGAGTGSYANQLYYTKNGSNTYFTVPYASNADKLDGWHNTKFCKVYTREEIGNTPNFDNLKDVDGNQVNGFFESRVNETTNATGKKPPYTSCAPMLSFLNQYVSLQLMGHSGEWYIRGGQAANVANANANINWERIVLNSGTWDISITGNAATASSVAWTNVTGRPTKITLTGSVTGSVSLGAGDLTLDTTTNHSHSWSSITSKPCTLISYSRNSENINANTWRTKECSLIEIRNTELTYSNLAMSGFNSFFNFWTPDGIVCT